MEEYGQSGRRQPPLRLEVLDHIRHNGRIKVYPDGSAVILLADRAIFREPGWEEVNSPRRSLTPWEWDELMSPPEAVELSQYALARAEERERGAAAASLARAQRRARAAVRDLGLCNDFRFFVTLTLSAERVDRYDVREVTRKLNRWLDNHVRRDGLAYVLVPERHKDGAIHFHGFFNNALPVVDSGTVDIGKGRPRRPRSAAQRAQWLAAGGHVVYNLPAWNLGFSTAIELYGSRRAAVGYVCKYIAKQMGEDGSPGRIGGRWYYSGGELRRPSVSFCDVDSADFEAYTGHEFSIAELGVRCKIIETEGGGGEWT